MDPNLGLDIFFDAMSPYSTQFIKKKFYILKLLFISKCKFLNVNFLNIKKSERKIARQVRFPIQFLKCLFPGLFPNGLDPVVLVIWKNTTQF